MRSLSKESKNEGNEDTEAMKSLKVRSRVWMYTQQGPKVPFDSIEALIRRTQEIPNIDKLAWIIHDKDIDKTGKPVEPHIHIGFTLSKRTTLANLARILTDRPQQFTCFTKRGQSVASSTKNLMGYLIHHTKEARKQKKYQYPVSSVHANFDYPAYIEQTEQITSTKDILDEYANEDITRDQAEGLLRLQGGVVLARNTKSLDAINSYVLEEKRRRWLKKKSESQEPIRVIWLSGEAGTGKTSFARKYAESHDLSYFVTTSQNDPFQGYDGQKVLIIDEIRPNTIAYADLLQICDPYMYDKKLTARYRNPSFQSDIIFLTSVFPPLEFYNAMHLNSEIDTFDQLNRRIGMNLQFYRDIICQFVYDFNLDRKIWFTENVKAYPNHYSGNAFGNTFTLKDLQNYGDKIGNQSLKAKNHQSRPKQSDD